MKERSLWLYVMVLLIMQKGRKGVDVVKKSGLVQPCSIACDDEDNIIILH